MFTLSVDNAPQEQQAKFPHQRASLCEYRLKIGEQN